MAMNLEPRRLAAKDNRDRLVRGLGWFSIGLGLAELLAPRMMCRFIGVKPRTGLLRLLGLREIANGVGLLIQPNKAAWMKSRVAGDAMDLGLMGFGFLDRQTNRGQLALATAAVAGVTAVDVVCSKELSEGAGMRPPRPGKTRGAVHLKHTLIVNRPPEDLYRVWRNFEELPRFMHHVISVSQTGSGNWRWTVKGPAGLQVEWDAEITDDRPGELIAWRSLPNADVDNTGAVSFERAPGGRGTMVRVELSYRPPAGKTGATVAKLLSQSPEKQVTVDLLRFKQMVETGEIARTEGQPAGRARSTSRMFDDLVRA
jgi:uncharacterized membrane protein